MSEFTEIGPNRLRRNSLGLVAVTFMVISAAAPLTGVAGAMPLAGPSRPVSTSRRARTIRRWKRDACRPSGAAPCPSPPC